MYRKRIKPVDAKLDINIIALSSEIGLKIAIPLLALLVLGVWIDGKLNSEPTFILIGIFTALGSSTFMIYKMIKRVNQQ